MSALSLKQFLLSATPGFLKPHWQRIEASPLGYRLAKGAFWSLAGTAISRGLSLISSVLVARWLGKDLFGEFSVLQSTIGMFGVFAGLGMGITATKHVAELRITNPLRAGRLVGLSNCIAWTAGAVMTLLLCLLAEPLAKYTLSAPHLAVYLRWCAPLLLFGGLNGAQLGTLTGFEAFKCITQINVFSASICLLSIAIGTWTRGLDGALAGVVVGQVITWALTGLVLRRVAKREGVRITHRGCLKESRVLWSFSLPSVVTGILVIPVNWACAAILVNQPNGYGEMGLFNVANQWRGFVMLIPNTLINMTLPILANMAGQNDRLGHRRVSSATIFFTAGVAALLALGVGAMSHIILRMYGTDYQGGSMSMWLLGLSAVPAVYAYAVSQILASRGQVWVSAAILVIWAAILLLLTLGLAPRWGSGGLALANLIAQVAYALIQFAFVRKLTCGTAS